MKSSHVAALLLIGCAVSIRANTVSGGLWHVSESASQNAIPANVPNTAPDVTFSVDSPFNFSASGATVATWLASSSAFNIVENTAGALNNLMDPSLVQFQGVVTVVNGQQFTVTHDDGLTLIINGIDLGFSGAPTSPVQTTETYNGPSGTFPFELVYGECCGGPAVLQISLPLSNNPVPESGSMLALLGLASASVIGFRRLR